MSKFPIRINEIEPDNKIVLSKFKFSCDQVRQHLYLILSLKEANFIIRSLIRYSYLVHP